MIQTVLQVHSLAIDVQFLALLHLQGKTKQITIFTVCLDFGNWRVVMYVFSASLNK